MPVEPEWVVLAWVVVVDGALLSDEAAGVHGERIVATEFETWLRDRSGRHHDHEG